MTVKELIEILQKYPGDDMAFILYDEIKDEPALYIGSEAGATKIDVNI